MKKNKLLQSVAIGVAGILMVGGLTACDQTEIMVGMDGLSAYELAVQNGYEGNRTTLERLVAAGLDSLPGAGAEILTDRVRRAISPAKPNVEAWLVVMHATGVSVLVTERIAELYFFSALYAQGVSDVVLSKR